MPKTVSDLHRFLGLKDFYRKSFPDTVRKVIFDLTKDFKKHDKRVINWKDEARNAFKQLMEDLASSTLLHHPTSILPVVLMVDASNSAMVAALQQVWGNNIEHLAFFLKKLSPSQLNTYDRSTYDRELLVAYSAVMHFRYFFEGRYFRFSSVINH